MYEESDEARAFERWQLGEFNEVERDFARVWRHMLTTLDLKEAALKMRSIGIAPTACKSIQDAHALATALVQRKDKPFDQIALLFLYLAIPPDLQGTIVYRWSLYQYRPIAEYAPIAAHDLAVELFFQIALGALSDDNYLGRRVASRRNVTLGELSFPPGLTEKARPRSRLLCRQLTVRDDPGSDPSLSRPTIV